jgi:prepilin-type N-terminal cleavage/methylation domain-containing protein/prepilin-type processing-associated H-X9-DG protein
MRKRRREAFTLIELLIVVTVITILLCMMPTALRAVKMRAHDAECQNNLHQLFVAVQLYSDAWHGYAPASLAMAQPVLERYGPEDFSLSLLSSAHAATLDSDRPTFVSHYYKDSRLLACPRAFSKPSYGIHREIATVTCTLRNIEHPSVIPFVFDAGVHLGSTYSDLAYRHSLTANGAFVDGHVAKVKFFPERAFPNIILLPGPHENPDEHPEIDPGDHHDGSHPADPSEQVDDDAREGNVESIQCTGRSYLDPRASTLEFTFRYLGDEPVSLTHFVMEYSKIAYFEFAFLNGACVWTAADQGGGTYGASGQQVTHTTLTVPPGGTFTIGAWNFRADAMGAGDKVEMRPVNFEFRFSNGSIALSPGEEAQDPSDPYGYAVLVGTKIDFSGTGTLNCGGAPCHVNNSVKMKDDVTIAASMVSACGNISLDTNSVIDGDAKGEKVDVGGNAEVTGTITRESADRVELPTLNLQPYYEHALAHGQVYNGDVTLRDGQPVEPAGGVMYVRGKIAVEADCSMKGCFIAEGDVKIDASVTHEKVARYPAFVAVNGDIDFAKPSTTHGLIYAIRGKYKRPGGGNHTGSIITAGDFVMSGDWSVGAVRYQDSTPVPPGVQ